MCVCIFVVEADFVGIINEHWPSLEGLPFYLYPNSCNILSKDDAPNCPTVPCMCTLSHYLHIKQSCSHDFII